MASLPFQRAYECCSITPATQYFTFFNSNIDNHLDSIDFDLKEIFIFCNFRYGACHESNPNGFNFGTGTVTPYAVGIVWLPITTFDSSLAKIEMSIRGNA